MAREIPLFKSSFLAAASMASGIYKAVMIDASAADTVKLCTAITDHPIGICQNNPASGGVVEVMHAGISKYVAQGAVTRGDMLGLGTTDGSLVTITLGTETTVQVIGQALDTVADGNIGTCLFSCMGQGRAA